MRRLFVVLLLVLAAAASFAYLVRLDAGYVLIELHGYTVETTAWVAALLVFGWIVSVAISKSPLGVFSLVL